jgi:hypothetical protein
VRNHGPDWGARFDGARHPLLVRVWPVTVEHPPSETNHYETP